MQSHNSHEPLPQIFHKPPTDSVQEIPSEEIYQIQRYSVGPSKPRNSRVKRINTLGDGSKGEISSNKIDYNFRLAAKGLRQPITGQLPTNKILKQYRQGPSRAKKGLFFLCC